MELKQGEQRTIEIGEQILVSCQACGLRQNLKPSELADPSRIFCTGHGCQETFSAKEGIKNAITSENDFMAWCFISNTMIYGRDIVKIGTTKTIKLKTPVRSLKKILITKVGIPTSNPQAYIEPKFGMPDELSIISSGIEDDVGKTIDFFWTVYANTGSDNIEPWRQYLQKAKESLIEQDFQDAIVQAEIAVEVTLEAILWKLLTQRKGLGDDVADWILSNIKGVSDRSKHVMELAIGKKISDINPIVYKSWVHEVAQKRNRIVHRGELATKEEAVDAIGAAFEISWLLLELTKRRSAHV